MINKLKFNLPTKPTSLQKTQQLVRKDAKTRKVAHNHHEILVPLQKFPTRHHINKPVRSQGKSNEKQKVHIFDLNSIKNSFLFRKDRQSLQMKNPSKKRAYTNRIYTEKGRPNQQILEFDREPVHKNSKKSVRKIMLRTGFSKSKQYSPNRKVISSNEKLIIIDSNNATSLNKMQQSTKVKAAKNKSQYTQFQKEQMKKYEVFYNGKRRISNSHDFTDSQGNPKIFTGDSIAYRYQILSPLGKGSFGQVYKAYDHKKKELVALKIIKSQMKFLKQAKVQVEILECALLNDPKLRCNLVRMKGSFVFRGHSCITFEILHKNLYQFLKQNTFAGFSLDLIRRFSIQILQCLHFFKKFNIVHCDLKPQNILLKQENKSGVRVIDVGSGCFQPKQIYTYIQSRFYRAPQIILGIKYTPAIDMWSFGCILVQFFTGFPIFPGESQNQQMLMFMQVLGLPPYSMLEISERRRKFFNDQFQCKISQEKGKQRKPNSLPLHDLLGTQDKQFLNLIKRCLEWDPSKRITPRQALLHPWIINGLPESIRVQHVEQIEEDQE